MTTAARDELRCHVSAASAGTWFCRDDFDDDTVDVLFAEMVRDSLVVAAADGLWWRCAATRFGPTRPSPLAVAVRLCGPGVGPCGVTAANWLSLSTQVPAVCLVAVPGDIAVPEVAGVRFETGRHVGRRERALSPAEVALIEMLSPMAPIEAPPARFSYLASRLAEAGNVRAGVLEEQMAAERAMFELARWQQLTAIWDWA